MKQTRGKQKRDSLSLDSMLVDRSFDALSCLCLPSLPFLLDYVFSAAYLRFRFFPVSQAELRKRCYPEELLSRTRSFHKLHQIFLITIGLPGKFVPIFR